jgi:integrase/recombinase XerC
LDATGGDFRKVAKFSRHKDIKVLFFYDDNRQDLGGDVAAMVAGLV